MDVRSIKCHQIIDSLKTFDIVLMHGVGGSYAIEAAIDSPWSHVGMVVRAEDIGLDHAQHPVLLWESTIETNLPDEMLCYGKKGPMLVDFHERIRTNIEGGTHSMIAVRYLEAERTPNMFEGLKKAIHETHGCDFPSGLELVEEFIRGKLLGQEVKDNDLFCSELVAHTYISAGLVPEEFPPNSFNPKDFSSDGYVPLLNRSTLSNEVYIGV